MLHNLKYVFHAHAVLLRILFRKSMSESLPSSSTPDSIPTPNESSLVNSLKQTAREADLNDWLEEFVLFKSEIL